MPQDFHVVKCFKCKRFQVDIKKVGKWTCKICGAKQSLMQKFGDGTSKNCREIVQNMSNLVKDEKMQNKNLVQYNLPKKRIEEDYSDDSDNIIPNLFPEKTKWADLVEDDTIPNLFSEKTKWTDLVENNTITNNLVLEKMPQDFHVVKCFKCKRFQVDIKKVGNWICKICGAKQSLMQKFGDGTSKKCREIVQNMNIIVKDEKMQNKNLVQYNLPKKRIEKDYSDDSDNIIPNLFPEKTKWADLVEDDTIPNLFPKKTKWTDLVEDNENLSENKFEVHKNFDDNPNLYVETHDSKRKLQTIFNLCHPAECSYSDSTEKSANLKYSVTNSFEDAKMFKKVSSLPKKRKVKENRVKAMKHDMDLKETKKYPKIALETANQLRTIQNSGSNNCSHFRNKKSKWESFVSNEG